MVTNVVVGQVTRGLIVKCRSTRVVRTRVEMEAVVNKMGMGDTIAIACRSTLVLAVTSSLIRVIPGLA